MACGHSNAPMLLKQRNTTGLVREKRSVEWGVWVVLGAIAATLRVVEHLASAATRTIVIRVDLVGATIVEVDEAPRIGAVQRGRLDEHGHVVASTRLTS